MLLKQLHVLLNFFDPAGRPMLILYKISMGQPARFNNQTLRFARNDCSSLASLEINNLKIHTISLVSCIVVNTVANRRHNGNVFWTKKESVWWTKTE